MGKTGIGSNLPNKGADGDLKWRMSLTFGNTQSLLFLCEATEGGL